ncbi:enoyl-CoA hydratase [Sporobacter termitidis DSM 10068]|uniref:short-chain-enoyl-CoA hydratase n=1 Tax=Sporobacter termitidis DSM 10068 TaxID=1123282 RepID=A0A1M5ZG18_9FIRM|nr:short-chain-enoyl-CoA hydratase [Sporobacter termitidis]SHI23139.1 enoyl-CoA hydratase [Sporobacter termitidis DSM 10068]
MNVSYEVKGHVALLTINRPEALNALNTNVLQDLAQALSQAEADNDVYVLVLTGAGKAFVAGADISQMKDFTAVEAKAFGDYGNGVFYKIESMSKPVIAAINGYALGGGCELAMASDIRIAGTKAKFGQPEVGLGITPGFGGTQRLPRIVGASKAKELILTAETIGADEALRIGLVSKVVPDEELLNTALEMANKIAANAQVAVRQSKDAINKGMQSDIATGLAYEAQAFAVCFATEDQKDAMTAFVSKSKVTQFKNK